MEPQYHLSQNAYDALNGLECGNDSKNQNKHMDIAIFSVKTSSEKLALPGLYVHNGSKRGIYGMYLHLVLHRFVGAITRPSWYLSEQMRHVV